MTETVAHNPAETRFEIRVDGERAGFASTRTIPASVISTTR